MPEESPSPANSSESNDSDRSPRPADGSAAARVSAGSVPRRRSSAARALATTFATLKVQLARLAGDLGEGLVAFSGWLKAQTTPDDETTAKAVSQGLLESWGQLWSQWAALLEPVRSRLPRKLGSTLTDSRLTGALVGVVVFFFVAASSGPGSNGPVANGPGTNGPGARVQRSSGDYSRGVPSDPSELGKANRPTPPRPAPKLIQPTVVARPYQGPPKSPVTPASDLGSAPKTKPETKPEEKPETKPVTKLPSEEIAPLPVLPVPQQAEPSEAETFLSEKPIALAPVVPFEASPAEESADEESADEESAQEPAKEPAKEPDQTPLKRIETSPEVPATKLIAPSTEASLPAIAPPQAPPPSLPPLTPAQQRAVAFQTQLETQIKTLAAPYGEGLVAGLQANIGQHELVVKLGDPWFDLVDSAQDELVQDLQTQSKRLDFSRIKILDRANHPLVRSPVVGEQMIILQRRKSL